MENWKQQEIEGKIKKSIRSKLGLLGKRVRRMGEEGIIVICAPDWNGKEPEYFIEFKDNDCEQLLGLPFKIWDDNKDCFVEEINGIQAFFTLTDKEKEFLNIDDSVLRKI
jgi:hypothetical protein